MLLTKENYDKLCKGLSKFYNDPEIPKWIFILIKFTPYNHILNTMRLYGHALLQFDFINECNT